MWKREINIFFIFIIIVKVSHSSKSLWKVKPPLSLSLSDKPNTVFQGPYKMSRESLPLPLPLLSVPFTLPSFLILQFVRLLKSFNSSFYPH